MDPNGKDMTNDLTYVILEVIDEMSSILEPKPNVRLHKNTPEKLLDTVVDMISSSQSMPLLHICPAEQGLDITRGEQNSPLPRLWILRLPSNT